MLGGFCAIKHQCGQETKKAKKAQTELWPDGTKMDAWFSNAQKVNVDTLGKKYVITDYGVKSDSTLIQTQAIQAIIDQAAKDGGGVIVFLPVPIRAVPYSSVPKPISISKRVVN